MDTHNASETPDHLVLAMDMLIGDPEVLKPDKDTPMLARNLYIPKRFAYHNFYSFHEDSTRGDAAREVLAIIDEHQINSGNAVEFALDNGSTLHIEDVPRNLSSGLEKSEASHEAIALTKRLISSKKKAKLMTGSGRLPVVARLEKLDVLKYNVEPYLGRRSLRLPWDYTAQWYTNRKITPEMWAEFFPDELPLKYNEFVSFKKVQGQSYSDFNWIGRFDPEQDALVPLKYVHRLKPFGVYPLNDGQAMVMEGLMAPPDVITNVIISGQYGTGKTFLTLAVALAKTEGNGDKSIYDQIVVCPSDSALGNEQGYLKGDLLDKMRPALGPVEDSLRSLIKMRGANTQQQHIEPEDDYNGNKRKRKQYQPQSKVLPQMTLKSQIDWYMLDSGLFDFKPIIFMRGRSIPNSIIMCDEWQDSDRRQSKRLLTRPAVGSKFVALGDPTQLGNPHLTASSNGLVYASRLCSNDPNSVVVTLFKEESVRNPQTAAMFDK